MVDQKTVRPVHSHRHNPGSLSQRRTASLIREDEAASPLLLPLLKTWP